MTLNTPPFLVLINLQLAAESAWRDQQRQVAELAAHARRRYAAGDLVQAGAFQRAARSSAARARRLGDGAGWLCELSR